MVTVTAYTHYREFLRAWIDERKNSPRAFSARQFARQAGLASPNYLQRVTGGDVRLTDAMIEKFVKGLHLKGTDARYFRTLVRFNQAESSEQKLMLLHELEKISSKSRVREVQDRNFFKHWSYAVIWELASCKDFPMEAQAISDALSGEVTPKEATRAIEFLLSAGYLVRGENGRYSQTPLRPESTEEVLDVCLQAEHRQFSSLGKEAIALPVEDREFRGVTIAISEERLALAKQKLKDFSKELTELLANDAEARRVYRINLQLFPVTRERLSPPPLEREK